MLALGFAAALRRSELCGLEVGDLRFMDDRRMIFSIRRSIADQVGSAIGGGSEAAGGQNKVSRGDVGARRPPGLIVQLGRLPFHCLPISNPVTRAPPTPIHVKAASR